MKGFADNRDLLGYSNNNVSVFGTLPHHGEIEMSKRLDDYLNALSQAETRPWGSSTLTRMTSGERAAVKGYDAFLMHNVFANVKQIQRVLGVEDTGDLDDATMSAFRELVRRKDPIELNEIDLYPRTKASQ